MTYEDFKKAQNRLLADMAAKAQVLRELRGGRIGPMGLTPDHVKATPEWRQAKAAFHAAEAKLKKFNGAFVKTFKKEIKADIQARRDAKTV
ncbi:MAG: hypothetical protein AAF982_08750 [Pseudomonadota bacterium]